MDSTKKSCWIVPFGGNGFVTELGAGNPKLITPYGISDWTSASTTVSLYFHTQFPGKVLAALRLSVPEGSSKISVNFSQENTKVNESREISINGSESQLVNCGIFNLPSTGYVKVELKGLQKTGHVFAKVSHLILVSENHPLLEELKLRYVAEPEDFYFGRRGPSVHFRYLLPEGGPECEYFYNEIFVPREQDIIGAYYCAMGFNGGYFGIQVNSESERRVLFSIWSDFNTDDPTEIPEEYKVTLIRKGEDVYVGEFGDEGSGAQSYLRYMWEPETTQRFIVQAIPLDEERTMYTAWFSSGSNQWQLIASFMKPKASTFFKGPYSFSENFIPEQGHLERHCIFANQWAYDTEGKWTEIKEGQFTADATSNQEQRMDVAGGVGIDGDKRRFYLRNCGFFSDRVEPRTYFQRESSGQSPPVDLSILP